MRVAIIGMGLIGGSLGLALRAAGVQVTCYARRPQTAARALERGAADSVSESPSAAVVDCDIAVIAVPVLAVKDILVSISGGLGDGAVVTDVASTKAHVMGWAREILPPGVSFIGGHPMAGRETSGIDAADAELFRGCTYCLVPAEGAASGAYETLEGLVRSIGADPLRIDAAEHDRLVAGISHLPLLISASLVASTTGSPLWPSMARLAASGYRDTTRLASGDPGMARDIYLTNREPVLNSLDEYIKELEAVRRLIEEGDGGSIEEYFKKAREARENWLRRK